MPPFIMLIYVGIFRLQFTTYSIRQNDIPPLYDYKDQGILKGEVSLYH
jgi:hypothetical protein